MGDRQRRCSATPGARSERPVSVLHRAGTDRNGARGGRVGAGDRDPARSQPVHDQLYRYAANKTALLDGVVELVLDELHINAAAEDWRQELRTLAHDFRDLARAHPNVLSLVVTRPPATPLRLRPPGTLRPLEDFLQLLTRAGLTTTNALHAYRLFFGFLHGHVLAELQEHVTNPEETEDLLRLGLHRLSPEKFPQLRTLGAALTGYDPAAQLDLGVDLMLTGLATYLQPTPPHPTAPA